MNLLSDVMADDNAFAFNDTDAFAESVTLRLTDGSTRTIKVVVDRDVLPMPDEELMGAKEIMVVSVSNHATLGIPSATFNAAKYRIDLAYRVGETVKTYILGMPVSIDTGRMIFRVK